MKNLIFVISVILLSALYYNSNALDKITGNQDKLYFDYEKEWIIADSLINQGFPKSALEVVQRIYETAKSEVNQQNYIKAIFYKAKIRRDIEEYDIENAIDEVKADIPIAPFPSKNILHSALAELYWNYYTNNKYKFLDRSEVVNFKLEDMKTWDLKKIVDEVIENYKLSLENAGNLQSIKLDEYQLLLIKQKIELNYIDGREFRPTLYDLLAHSAIDFFMSSEPDVTKPAEQFTLNDDEFFSSANDYVNINIETKDTYSYKFYAAKLFQDLLKFHLYDYNPDALIISDLKRLEFVYSNSANQEKINLYVKALQNIQSKYSSSPVSAEAIYDEACIYYNNATKYDPHKSEEYKWESKKAYDLCQTGIDKYPESVGAKNCKALQGTISTKSVQLTFEETNAPGKPFRCLINFKNLNRLYFRVIETTQAEFEELSYSKPEDKGLYAYILEYYKGKNPIHKFEVTLPDDGDYQSHSAESKISELPLGKYIILAGTDENLVFENNAVTYSLVNVSKISYISRYDSENNREFYLLNSITGEPLAQASVQIWDYFYDYNIYRYQKTKGEKLTADNEGHIIVKAGEKYRDFYLEVTTNDESVLLENYFYIGNKYAKEDNDAYTTLYFFTDRAIYRPGQTVYFKAIAISTKEKDNKIVPDNSYNVVFLDANSKEISNQDLKTNEYGTINGSFTAPTSGLNGKMTIQCPGVYGSVQISVEDYKRPKFEVKINELNDSYKLGENVKVTGLAKAYSGANIDNANMKFRVVRKTFFPDWWWFWYGSYYKQSDVEITSGTAKTDENGNYEFNFTAVPDLTVPAESKPTYTYTVNVDVTDLNGETRSASKYVSVGYVTLRINTDIPDKINKNGNTNYKIMSRNLSGVYVPASGSLSIYRLKNPDKAYRTRLWGAPDKFILSETEFHNLFPEDVYAEENNMLKWEKEKEVFSQNFNTANDTSLNLNDLRNYQTGEYLMEILSKDNFGQDVKELKYFTIYSTEEKTLPYPSANWFEFIKSTVEPYEDAQFLAGSSANNQNVLYEIEREGEIIHKEWIKFSGEQKLFLIPIKEEYRGNIDVHFSFISNNRCYLNSSTITVPYTNKQLDISFETFRNKLQPGEQDEWKIKIKDKRGDKVAAEMLATLYDASLDAFAPHSWGFNIYQSYYSYRNWEQPSNLGTSGSTLYQLNWNEYAEYYTYVYDYLNTFGLIYNSFLYYPSMYNARMMDGVYEQTAITPETGKGELKRDVYKNSDKESDKKTKKGKDDDETERKEELPTGGIIPPGMPLRANFNETAFFYPELRTDENGEIIISFKVPESLTKWKMLGFATTKDLKYGLTTNELVTQKDLMVNSNFPRFFREGDNISISSKITNLSDADQKGSAQLQLFDAITMNPVDQQLIKGEAIKSFEVLKGQSTTVTYDLAIPEDLYAVTWRVYAKTENFSDGEESTLPVLNNRILVTETLPMPIRSNQTKEFKFEKLINNVSPTISNFNLTLEFTSNPAWYAIQALPYMMEYPWECVEQTFNRFYANSIATHIANSNPKIKDVFDTWAKNEPDALTSNLEKNQELKTLILEETPWVRDAENESERKRRVGVLFEIGRMKNELEATASKLKKLQLPNGAWTWFEGMPEDRFMTQYFVTGFGRLDHLGIKDFIDDSRTWGMVKDAISYMDGAILREYEELLAAEKKGYIKLSDDNLGYYAIQYLYARSYFKSISIPGASQVAFDYFTGQAKKYWTNKSKYMQGMIGLSLFRFGEKSVPDDIIKSLKEYSIINEEMGMYWKQSYGYYWYEMPVEMQALMVELFDEVAKDSKAVDDLRVWLLKQKQTQNWRTTTATADAVYALILRGTDWLATEVMVDITVGNIKIEPQKMENVKVEAGTGYFKTSWIGKDITNDMGNITVTKKNEGVSWGAMYWQYFEHLDKITSAETPLSLKKQLFLKQNTTSGPVITPVDDNAALKVGDEVIVRMELRVDRNMEYVQLKDMRASCFEPLNVISQYKYQDNLGYYESTRDASTNFFFGYLPKGTYVFEYPLRVSQKGDFSNGIATIQCFYAPEFSSHSEGVRVKVTE